MNTELEQLYKEKAKLVRRLKALRLKEKQVRQEARQRRELEKLNDPFEKEKERFREERLKNPEYAKAVILLNRAIKHEGFAYVVAKKIGCSKAIVSLVAKGDYECDTKKFYAKLKEHYDSLIKGMVSCPCCNKEINVKTCKDCKEAAIAGKTLKNSVFAQVKDTCPTCSVGV